MQFKTYGTTSFPAFCRKKISDDYMEMFGIKGKKKGHGSQETSLSAVNIQELFHLNRHLHVFFQLLKKVRQQENSVNMAKKKALKFYCKNTKFEWNLLKTINKDKDCMVGYRFSPPTIQTSVKFMTLWSNNFTLKLDKFPYFEMLFPAVSIIDGY